MSLRSDLIKRVARRNPVLGEVVVSQILNVFFSAIVDHIREGCRVELRGFGSFSGRSYIFKSESSSTSSHSRSVYRRVYFRPSEKLVKAVNDSSTLKSGKEE